MYIHVKFYILYLILYYSLYLLLKYFFTQNNDKGYPYD